MKKFMIFIICFLEILSANKNFSKTNNTVITIYNNNIAFVQESKTFYIKKQGENFIRFDGVPKSIIIDSVLPKFLKATTLLLSQTFQKNLVNFTSLLSYYKKHNLSVEFFKPTVDKLKRVVSKGYILSYGGNKATLQNKKGMIYNISYNDIFFKSLPKELNRTTPSLIWRIKSNVGKQKVELGYLASGLSWRAGYILNIAKKADLQGWIDIKNFSGVLYKNATLYCMAGKVHMVRKRNYTRQMLYKNSISLDKTMIRNESFGGYYLYKIPFKEDIQEGLKEVRFLSKENISYKEYAVANIQIPSFQTKGVKQYSLNHIIEIKNIKSNSLGVALPKGVVRVFKKDKDKKVHFLGESSINNIPKNKKLKVNIGKFFDIKAKVVQIQYKSSNNRHYVYSKIKVIVENNGDKNRDIKIKGYYGANGNYKLSSTCNNECRKINISKGLVEYNIKLKGKKNYTFYIKYQLSAS